MLQKGMWIVLSLVLCGGFVVGCANEPKKECTSNRDCASNNCDPGTFRCIQDTKEGSSQEKASTESPQESVSPEKTGQELTVAPDEKTAGTEPTAQEQAQEPGPEPAQEPVKDASSTESTAEPPLPEAQPEQPSNPDGPVTQGPCQSTSPKCPAGYLCRDDVTPAQCHRTCDPDQANTCPGGTLCLVLQTGEGICVTGTQAKFSEACDNNKICGPGLICLRSSSSSPAGTCRTRCTLANQTCPSGEYCYLVHSKNGVCIQGQAGSKGLGQACKNTPECQAGLICFTPFQQTPRCAQLCDPQNKCPSGERCAQLEGAPANTGACVK